MRVLQFASSALGLDHRNQAIEQVFSECLQMDIDIPEKRKPILSLQAAALSDVNLLTLSGTPAQAGRNATQARNSAEELVLCVTQHSEVCIRDKRKGEQIYKPGDAHIWRADKEFSCDVNSNYSTLMVSLPAASIEALDVDAQRCLDHGLIPASSEMNMLAGYSRLLMNEMSSLSEEAVGSASEHLKQLAIFALGTAKERKNLDIEQSLQAIRLKSIKEDIKNNFNHPDLSADWIAGREGISPRYLRSLFRMEDTSFTEYVLEIRLQQAHHYLTNPQYLHWKISSVVYEVGFNDLSYFVRCFKSRFGATPSDIRRAYAERLIG